MTFDDKALLVLWFAFIASFGIAVGVLLNWASTSGAGFSSWHGPALACTATATAILGSAAFAVTNAHARRLGTLKAR